jgi:hypothetical protein
VQQQRRSSTGFEEQALHCTDMTRQVDEFTRR